MVSSLTSTPMDRASLVVKHATRCRGDPASSCRRSMLGSAILQTRARVAVMVRCRVTGRVSCFVVSVRVRVKGWVLHERLTNPVGIQGRGGWRYDGVWNIGSGGGGHNQGGGQICVCTENMVLRIVSW